MVMETGAVLVISQTVARDCLAHMLVVWVERSMETRLCKSFILALAVDKAAGGGI
jgi:hypothetical protein